MKHLSTAPLLCLSLSGWTHLLADPIGGQREIYDVRMSQAMNLHADEMEQLAEQYSEALEGSAALLQQQGDLDGLLAVKAEILEFTRTGSVPAESPQKAHESVKKLQQIYRDSKTKADATKAETTHELTAKYMVFLEGLQKKLTQEGKLEEAIKVKAEAERARKLQADLPAWTPETVAQPQIKGNPDSPLVAWNKSRPQDLGVGIKLNHQGGNALTKDGEISLGGGRTTIEGLAGKLLEACQKSNAWSLVLHFETASLNQSGPARIFSFSENGHLRNFSICQENSQLVLRLRTTKTGDNGTNPEVKLGNIEQNKSHRIALSYQPGKLRYCIDGKAIPVNQIEGDFSNWKPYQIVLGNEWKDDRPWKGRIHSFSLFSSAMSERDMLTQTR